MKMAKAKWSFESAKDIRNDIREEYIKCVHDVMMEPAYGDEYKVHLLEGMMMLFDALKPYMEETPDENIQND